MAQLDTTRNLADEAAARNLAHHWGLWVVRGLLAIVFGILVFAAPKMTLLALVVLFGLYALADGISNVMLAVHRARARERWGSLLAAGILGVVAGAVAILWPGIGALGLLYVIAVWALVLGVNEIVAAVRLRKAIRGEWTLALAGMLGVAFGIITLAFPGAGALALMAWIGIFAIVSGVLLLGLAFRLRHYEKRPDRRAPIRGVPMSA